MAAFYNKRGGAGTFTLTVSDAYHWHRHCPCQPPRDDAAGSYIYVGGKGTEGEWSAAWLAWLARTHLEPRGIVVRGRPSRRMIDVDLPSGDTEAWRIVEEAIVAGPLTDEPMPLPPDQIA